MSRAAAGAAMAALAIGAVVWGVWTVGGPGAARLADADRRTWQAIRATDDALRICFRDRAMPDAETLEALAAECRDSFVARPLPGPPEEVRFERTGPRSYRLCGAFHDPEAVWRDRADPLSAFDAGTGCLGAELPALG